MNINRVTIGADPEVFVKKRGKLVSGYGMIPGTKDQPHRVYKGAVQVDGMALEFNINPANDPATFYANIRDVMGALRTMIPANHTLAKVPVAHFGADYMLDQPADALQLGCDPDYNAWTMEQNKTPNATVPFRTGAGHVHVGFRSPDTPVENEDAFHDAALVARQMDFFLALPSLFFDEETQRRELYGKAGAFRVKPYGMEYRVLSNAWLRNKALITWVFRNSREAFNQLLKDNFLEDRHGDIQEIINTSNKEAAREIIIAENIEVPRHVNLG